MRLRRVATSGEGGAALRALFLLGVLGLVLLAAAGAGSTSTYLGRWIWWNRSDVEDHRRFPSRVVENGDGEGFRFATADTTVDPVVEVERDGDRRRLRLSRLARETETTALLVIRRDTLLFEDYFHGHDRSSLVTSFSVAKSVTSLLAGIAVGERLVASVDDPVTDYLPDLGRRDPGFERITVRHLLNMRSGIAFRDHDLPWGDKPRAYYDPHLRQRLLEEIEIARPPGETWSYNTYNPQLLGLVLQRVSGGTVAAFTSSRLWRPLDMEFPATWSVDGATAPLEKMESGLNARAVDFARIGRLVLHRGRWEGRQVVPERWIEASTRTPPGCELDGFRPARVCYRLGWWVTPAGGGQRHAGGAWGHLGQYVYLFPADDLVMVRFGRETGGVSWPAVFRSVADAVAGGGGGRVSAGAGGEPWT